MKPRHRICLFTALLAVVWNPLSAAPIFFGPTPYLSAADIPAGLYAGGPTFLETFEDGTLSGGITASAGAVIPPGFPGLIDSVDADDGTIDGSGLHGHSWFYGLGAVGVRFFLPTGTTAAGLVWTDGAGAITFEAFNPMGISLGILGPLSGIPGPGFTGATAEDRFFGVADTGGIGSILIKNSGGGIEVDHVQYGIAASSAVPEAGSAGAILLAGALGLMMLHRSRSVRQAR